MSKTVFILILRSCNTKSQETLNSLANTLVVDHTDSSGNHAYNITLYKNRAEVENQSFNK